MRNPPAYEAFPQVDTGTHGGRVVQLLALPGGRVLASAGETTIRLWDLADKRLLRLLLGRVKRNTDDDAWDGKVARIAASPDGRWLVALKPWCHAPGRHRCAPEDAAVGHDAGRATEVQVFDTATGNLQSRHLYPGQLLDLDFSPDGRRLALAANRRVGRLRQAEVLLVATRDLLRPGAQPAPKPLARLALGTPRRASTLPVALRFVPGTAGLLVAAVAEPWAERAQIAWLRCTPGGRIVLQRSVALDAAVGVETMSVGATMLALGTEPPKRSSERGRVAWFRHDGSDSGTLDIEAPPASTAFSPSGHRLAVGLMVDLDGDCDARSGTQVVQVNAYDVPPIGQPALRSTYFGHDDTVSALAFVGEDQVASAGGDNQALHFWSPQHRVAVQQAAIRGVGRVAYLPGITAQERVLFGSVPQRQLPPGHPPRQQSFCLHRHMLATTRASDVRARDYVSRRWFVGDFDEAVIRLWFIGDQPGPRPQQAPAREPDLSLFVGADDEWVLWTTSGYYDASPRGGGRIGYRVNRDVAQEALLVPSDRFKAFYRPELVAAVVRHGTEARARARGVALPALDVAAMLPPIVELARDGIRRQGDRVAIRFTVDSPNPALPLTRLSLLRNGRVVWAERAPPKRAHARCEVPPLLLLPGPNRFSLQAENAQAKAVPVAFEIEGPAQPAAAKSEATSPGRLFLLSVGVSEFVDPRNLPLRFPTRDAQAVFDAIGHGRLAPGRARRRGGNRAFASVDARLLLNAQATKAAILAELDRMCEAIVRRQREDGSERDVLFVFLSGHGMRVWEHGTPGLYFVNHDLVPTAEDVDATGLSILELGERMTAVPAEVVLVVDACHAALAGSDVAGALDPEEMARRVHAIYERGLYVVGASRDHEFSREALRLRSGVLTAAVLRALRETPAGREVLMAELLARVQRLVPEVSARAGTAPQTPVCRVYGDLVPLSILKT